jgi:hypothetical protein
MVEQLDYTGNLVEVVEYSTEGLDKLLKCNSVDHSMAEMS